jgi:hypothetical protein
LLDGQGMDLERPGPSDGQVDHGPSDGVPKVCD